MSFKKITILSLVAAGAFAAVATTTATPTQAAKKTTITAITDGNVAPFAVKEKSGKLDGYDVDVLKAVVKRLPQYKLKWKIAEYDALLGNIDSGRADVGVNHFGKTAERQEKYLFSKPIFQDKPIFIVKKSNNKIKSFNSAAGHTTVAQVGTGFSLELEAYNKTHKKNPIKITYVKDYHDLQDISQGKYDFAYTDLSMYKAEQKQYKIKDVKAVKLTNGKGGTKFNQPYTYVVFGKTAKDKKFQKAVNKELVKLAKDGTLTKISKKYLGANYVPAVLKK